MTQGLLEEMANYSSGQEIHMEYPAIPVIFFCAHAQTHTHTHTYTHTSRSTVSNSKEFLMAKTGIILTTKY
jgi:hypothetical protein